MPTFFLHLIENGVIVEDREGAMHADIDAAVANAIQQIRKMLAMDIVETGHADLDRMIEITSAHGAYRRITFSQAVSVSV